MVQILVKTEGDPSSIKEWAVIEIQGDIEHSDGGSVGGKFVGQLLFTSEDKPVLIVGYHILFGKVIENNPPLAILRKVRPSDFSSEAATQATKKKSTEFHVVAFVKRKIIFKTRPKPIVTSLQPTL